MDHHTIIRALVGPEDIDDETLQELSGLAAGGPPDSPHCAECGVLLPPWALSEDVGGVLLCVPCADAAWATC